MNENKCEKLGIQHAWRSTEQMYGFSIVKGEKCINCELSKTIHSSTEKWYSYSDGRPNEPIFEMRPI